MKKSSLLLAGVVAVFVTSCNTSKEEKETAEKFLVTSPLKADTTITKDYVSVVHAFQHIELRAQERGYLEKIYIDEGQHVKKGQLLFQIMPALYSAEAQTKQSEVEFAEIEYKNTKALADSNIVSKNQLAMAKARLNKARAELQLAQTHLGFTEIRAPFDGIIDKFHVRLGSLIDEGDLLTSLSDNSKLWVYFNVPEAEYLSFRETNANNKYPTVKLQMANQELFNHDGVIETIEADFDTETGNIAFRATFPNPEGLLRHGETGNVQMPIHIKNTLIIPQQATFEVLDKLYVYVVDNKNILHTQEITTIAELPHLFVVGKGLKKTDKVLLDGLRKVNNNQEIDYTFKSASLALKELNKLFAE